jgi:hypothetical protein
MTKGTPSHVVIVGGAFGGLSAARALKDAPVRVTVIDRSNHCVFQPLLYQVATATLAPGDIAAPIRQLLRRQPNATVAMAEVTGVDAARRQVLVDYLGRPNTRFEYDYLVLATGASHSYFGHDEFAPFAPGIKSLADAVSVRARVLKAFEMAEIEEDPAKHQDLLTFVLVGAGPTGVEMAGALAELRLFTLKSDFRRINPEQARIILAEAGPRILGTLPEEPSRKAQPHDPNRYAAGHLPRDLPGQGLRVLDSKAAACQLQVLLGRPELGSGRLQREVRGRGDGGRSRCPRRVRHHLRGLQHRPLRGASCPCSDGSTRPAWSEGCPSVALPTCTSASCCCRRNARGFRGAVSPGDP